jgi:phosphate transport system protein
MTEHEHIVSAFSQEIEALRTKILRMGGLAEQLLADAVATLDSRDADRAAAVILADRRVDALQSEIDEEAIRTLARRQPMASDLREIIAVIRMAADLERVGDLAKNIAKRVAAIGAERHSAQFGRGLGHLSGLALGQLKDVLDAYARRDAAAAVAVRNRDGEIDALYNSLFRELLTYMMEDPRTITMSTHLLFCAKNIERIGDHATNIAETVHYVVAGEPLREPRPKDDSHNYASLRYPADPAP